MPLFNLLDVVCWCATAAVQILGSKFLVTAEELTQLVQQQQQQLAGKQE